MMTWNLSPLVWGRMAFCSGILLYLCAAGLTLAAGSKNASALERLARNKWIGLFGGWIALAICVPHAVVVSPQFLLPLLWPMAVIVPVLGFFFVDYPAARAVGGLLILSGYSLVHYTFDFHTPGAPAFAVLGWLTGIAGIWISGKPCAMRDYFRLVSGRRSYRFICGALWSVAALFALWALVMTRDGGAL